MIKQEHIIICDETTIDLDTLNPLLQQSIANISLHCFRSTQSLTQTGVPWLKVNDKDLDHLNRRRRRR